MISLTYFRLLLKLIFCSLLRDWKTFRFKVPVAKVHTFDSISLENDLFWMFSYVDFSKVLKTLIETSLL